MGCSSGLGNYFDDEAAGWLGARSSGGGTPACAGHGSGYGTVGDVGSGGSTRRCW
jgi:hypothetical protein